MKSSFIVLSAGMLALALSPCIHAQEVSLTQVPGRPLPPISFGLYNLTSGHLVAQQDETTPLLPWARPLESGKIWIN